MVVVGRRFPGSGVVVSGGPPEICVVVQDRLKAASIAGVELAIEEAIDPHIGLGSKTATLLACAEAALLCHQGIATREAILYLAGRGGASGIGVNAYFDGGLVGDTGHREPDVPVLLPSSGRQPVAPPRVLLRHRWPEHWRIVIARPVGSARIFGDSEAQFFATNTPIALNESALAALALLFEVPGAVIDVDFAGLRASLSFSRRVGLKALEIGLHRQVSMLLERLEDVPYVAATMSSLGPTVVLVSPDDIEPDALLKNCGVEGEWVTTTGTPSNEGRVVDYLV
jgi:beta-ribofuranosylaminobenzene 5'-phosphate synthase